MSYIKPIEDDIEMQAVIDKSSHKGWVKFQYIKTQLERLSYCPSARTHPGYGPRKN